MVQPTRRCICLFRIGFAFVFLAGIPPPCKQWTLWSRGLVITYYASCRAGPLRNVFKEGSASLPLSDDVDRPAEESGCPSGPAPWPPDRGLQGVAQSGDACQVFCPELQETYLLYWKKRKVANSTFPPARPQPIISEAQDSRVSTYYTIPIEQIISSIPVVYLI